MSQFVAVSRELCTWLEGPVGDDETERFTALVLLSKVHAAALQLPAVDSSSLPDVKFAVSDPETDLPEPYQRVMARLGEFPDPMYWRLEGD